MIVKPLVSLALLFSFLLTFSALGNSQQNTSTATFNAPFEFWVDGTKFAPGEYILTHNEPSMIVVRSKDGKQVEMAATLTEGDPIPEQDATVIFVLRNGKYQLVKISGPLGTRILTGHYGEDNGDGIREVKIAHTPATPASASKQVGEE